MRAAGALRTAPPTSLGRRKISQSTLRWPLRDTHLGVESCPCHRRRLIPPPLLPPVPAVALVGFVVFFPVFPFVSKENPLMTNPTWSPDSSCYGRCFMGVSQSFCCFPRSLEGRLCQANRPCRRLAAEWPGAQIVTNWQRGNWNQINTQWCVVPLADAMRPPSHRSLRPPDPVSDAMKTRRRT